MRRVVALGLAPPHEGSQPTEQRQAAERSWLRRLDDAAESVRKVMAVGGLLDTAHGENAVTPDTST